ncbi:MAG: restriction endonuclease subunit S [Gemmatimonadaceae bacterium]
MRGEKAQPPGWTQVALGDAGAWIGGGTPSKSNSRFWTDGTIPWVSPKDMKVRVIRKSADQITLSALNASATQLVPSGSVLVVTRSGILERTLPVALTAVAVTLNQDMKAIVPVEGIDASYLTWALTSHEEEILRTCRKAGTTVASIETSQLQRFAVPVAPLAEQRRIVAALEEHLSELDAAVAGLERARANANRYRSSLYAFAVRGMGAIADSHSLYTNEDESPFALPSKWFWSNVGRFVTSIQAGNSFKCEERPPELGETGVVKVSAVSWGSFDEDESKTVLHQERIDEDLLVRANDFLFSRANTISLVGACVIVGDVTRRVMLSDKILRIEWNELLPQWALVCLRSDWGRFEIERLATGNQESMRNIGQERIKAIRIPVPPIPQQRAIVGDLERRLSITDQVIGEIQTQLLRATRLRQSILKSAFDGTLVPQDPNDEPASVLLDRIRAERTTPPASAPRRRPRAATSAR